MDQVAVLAGGCFWCTEAVFLDVVGVKKVESGYTGGTAVNPTYKQVCGGDTGHAEAIRITFDPEQLSYADLLDIFRLQRDASELQLEPLDLAVLVRDLSTLVATEVSEQQAELRVVVGDAPVYVCGDGFRLQQALVRLVTNSLHAAGAGGLVEVALTVSYDANGGWAVIRVRDNGSGLPSDQLRIDPEAGKFGKHNARGRAMPERSRVPASHAEARRCG